MFSYNLVLNPTFHNMKVNFFLKSRSDVATTNKPVRLVTKKKKKDHKKSKNVRLSNPFKTGCRNEIEAPLTVIVSTKMGLMCSDFPARNVLPPTVAKAILKNLLWIS